MTKDIIATIHERRSVRKFKEQEVPKAIVGKIIDAARWAPSAGNIQPWQFYVVYNDEKKRLLISAALNQRFIGEAPVLIVVCVQPELSGAHYRERGRKLYCLQDSAAAVQNILLAATASGLGSCWVGAFNKTEVIEALDLPMGTLPVAMIPLGYPDEEAVSPGRRPVEETVRVIE